MGCIVYGIPVGVMQKGDGNLFIKVVPLISIILAVPNEISKFISKAYDLSSSMT
jgi:hypothetical protein